MRAINVFLISRRTGALIDLDQPAGGATGAGALERAAMDAAIMVHNAAQARAALKAAAALAAPVTLISAPGAAGYAGAAYFQALIAEARALYPNVAVTDILDCGAAPGHVLGALRQGLKAVRFHGDRATAEKLAAIAAAQGARLIAAEIAALDLSRVNDVEEACRAWLQRTAHA